MRTAVFVVSGLIVTIVALAPIVAARDLPDPPPCLAIHQRYDLGPVSIVRSDGSTSIERNGELTDACPWKRARC